VGYFGIVRRNLVVGAVVCSLLWAVTGVSVLAVALHEHVHHGHHHDHQGVLQTAIHGHAHEGIPDHDHELSAPLSASRFSAVEHSAALASQISVLADHQREESRTTAASMTRSREHGPPKYLMNCVFLT
jgi:hypothetical protein